MTSETRLFVEPEDLLGVEFTCGHCGAWCPRFASVFWTLTWAEERLVCPANTLQCPPADDYNCRNVFWALHNNLTKGAF